MQKIGATGDGKSDVATPDGKKTKEEEDRCYIHFSQINHYQTKKGEVYRINHKSINSHETR